MYGKIFESMYEGSLYGQWEAIVTMQQLIVLATADGIIDMTPSAIAGKTSIPLEIIEKGIDILSKPDPYSRTHGDDGVRIRPIDDHREWGWYLVNHEKYNALRKIDDKRKADRTRIANKRKSLKEQECRTASHSVANVAQEEVEVTVEIPPTEGAKDAPLKDQVWKLGPQVLGNSPTDRSYLGKLIKEFGEGSVLHALHETQKHGTGDPKSYMRGVLREAPEHKPRKQQGELTKEQIKERDALVMRDYGT